MFFVNFLTFIKHYFRHLHIKIGQFFILSIKRSALGVCAVISVVINIHKARDVHNERRAMSCDAVWVQCECSLRKFYYGICYSFLIVESLIKLQARR